MSIYYVQPTQKYLKNIVLDGLIPGDKTIPQMQKEISINPDFCREEKSIKKTDLISYLASGLTLYTLTDDVLSGVLNLDINNNVIKIEGLCVPPPSSGLGTLLIDAVKLIAKLNAIIMIKLTCYDEKIADYYRLKNGFRIINQTNVSYDSDDEDEDGAKIRYDMVFNVTEGGKRKSRRKSKSRKSRKSRKTRRYK